MEKIEKKVVSSGNNVPYKKFRAGAVVATVWQNESVSKDGQKIMYKTVSFERSYKDKNNNWQTTNTLRMNDLPKASLVLTKAYELLALSDDNSDEEE